MSIAHPNAQDHADGILIERLMLVDDNQFDQRLYARIIKRSGLVGTLLPFSDAALAVEHLLDPAEPLPNLVLLDVNMPGMDGFAFLECVTDKLGDAMCPVVVMLTTSLNPMDKQRAGAFSVVRDFLSKPLTEDLLSHIATLQK